MTMVYVGPTQKQCFGLPLLALQQQRLTSNAQTWADSSTDSGGVSTLGCKLGSGGPGLCTWGFHAAL